VNPRDAQLLGRLANCYAHLGDAARARALAAEAEAASPQDSRVLLLSGQVHERLGDRAQALARVSAALERGLPIEEIETARSLEALRNDPAFKARAR
jgi:tetratricopeptide (TPR) repeat protein